MIQLNDFQLKLIATSSKFAGVDRVINIMADGWVDVLHETIDEDKDSIMAWSGGPCHASACINLYTDGQIISASKGFCGYGSLQCSIETSTGLFLYAKTSGGHWVRLFLGRNGDVSVQCDGYISKGNWGDHDDSELHDPQYRSEQRALRLLDVAKESLMVDIDRSKKSMMNAHIGHEIIA